ncbi:hypothetical protein NON20_23215 [Synechocystis sp. B12]|nr:hypothetical protein NON20_23215 [Synechocystis sp. B12]
MRNLPMFTLNDQNLPYPDTLHPIIVHFVIGMVFFAYISELVGYLQKSLGSLKSLGGIGSQRRSPFFCGNFWGI